MPKNEQTKKVYRRAFHLHGVAFRQGYEIDLAIGVEVDGSISGVRIVEHRETPGLGDQMDKESWRAQMDGKMIYDDAGEPVIRVIKGLVPEDVAGAEHMLDGMAGATLTGNGITGLVQYWTGSHGFGPYLANFRAEHTRGGNTDE